MAKKLLVVLTLLLLVFSAFTLPAYGINGAQVTSITFTCTNVTLSYQAYGIDRDNTGTGREEYSVSISDGNNTILYQYTTSLTVGSMMGGLTETLTYQTPPSLNPIRLQLISHAGNGFPEQIVWDETGECDALVTPTSTPTDTATSTATNTPVAPTNTQTSTATNTLVPPTNTQTSTATNTAIPPTDTPTSTATNTLVPPTDTPTITLTSTLVPPTDTPTPIPEPHCVYPLPVGSVQGRVLIDVLAFYDPSLEATTNILVQGGTAWWISNASNGFYQIWISCQGQPVWVLANTMSPNFDSVWNGAALP